MPASASLFIVASDSASAPGNPLRRILRNSVVSTNSKRAYTKSFNDFFGLLEKSGQALSRAAMMEYRASMVEEGLSASTINLRLSAIRKLVREAQENGLLNPLEAERISRVPGVPAEGVRLGHWLTTDQARSLLGVPDRNTVKGKRDFAILTILVHCALRRAELARLDIARIQQRDGRWVIADLVGKRGRVRTVPVPLTAKVAIDEWTSAASITSGPLLRRINKGGRILPAPLSGWAVWSVVVASAQAIAIEHFGAHDLRRTAARLCQKSGGDLAQIKQILGHASILTTDRYLGSGQEIAVAVNDNLGI